MIIRNGWLQLVRRVGKCRKCYVSRIKWLFLYFQFGRVECDAVWPELE